MLSPRDDPIHEGVSNSGAVSTSASRSMDALLWKVEVNGRTITAVASYARASALGYKDRSGIWSERSKTSGVVSGLHGVGLATRKVPPSASNGLGLHVRLDSMRRSRLHILGVGEGRKFEGRIGRVAVDLARSSTSGRAAVGLQPEAETLKPVGQLDRRETADDGLTDFLSDAAKKGREFRHQSSNSPSISGATRDPRSATGTGTFDDASRRSVLSEGSVSGRAYGHGLDEQPVRRRVDLSHDGIHHRASETTVTPEFKLSSIAKSVAAKRIGNELRSQSNTSFEIPAVGSRASSSLLNEPNAFRNVLHSEPSSLGVSRKPEHWALDAVDVGDPITFGVEPAPFSHSMSWEGDGSFRIESVLEKLITMNTEVASVKQDRVLVKPPEPRMRMNV